LADTSRISTNRQLVLGIAHYFYFHLHGVIMEPKYLYTIRWTQTYATDRMRPYMRHLRNEYDQVIESKLERKEFEDANLIIQRIMQL
jgi:hypothetical protein